MGFFSRLFGSPKPEQTPEELQDLKEENARKVMETKMLMLAHDIAADYGGALEDSIKEGWSKDPKILLYPESSLPYPKETIRKALSLLLGKMEETGKEEIWGMTKTNLRGVALGLHDFAPDQEIPNDPRLNVDAYTEWHQKPNPYLEENYKNFIDEFESNMEILKIRNPAIFEMIQKFR